MRWKSKANGEKSRRWGEVMGLNLFLALSLAQQEKCNRSVLLEMHCLGEQGLSSLDIAVDIAAHALSYEHTF